MFQLIFGSILGTIKDIFNLVFSTEGAVASAEASVEVAAIQGSASVINRWWFIAAAVAMFAFTFAIYDFKAVVWDNVIMGGHAKTPALKGDVATVHLVVVGGLFLHSLLGRMK